MNNYLNSINRLFHYYKDLADKAIAQLPENMFHKIPAEGSNSISIIMKHMAGNMRSRFSDFLITDGEKPWRKRDEEFEEDTKSNVEIIAYWNQGWICLFNTLDSLTEDDLEKIIYIRNEGHTVMEALNRQLAHYAYHVGQIVYLAKLWKGQAFQSLSIPKGQSDKFNAEKFGNEPQRKHFI